MDTRNDALEKVHKSYERWLKVRYINHKTIHDSVNFIALNQYLLIRQNEFCNTPGVR